MKQVLILMVAIIMAVTVMAQPGPKAKVPQPAAPVAAAPAQPQDEVVITNHPVSGPVIRIAVQDTTGKVKDAGKYYHESEYNRLVAANQRMGKYIQEVTMAGFAILDPKLAEMLADTGYVLVKRNLLPQRGGQGAGTQKKNYKLVDVDNEKKKKK